MNFQESLKMLKASKEFKSFKKKHADAYLCTGFFILDYESKNNLQQIDFQMGKEIAQFSVLADKIELKTSKSVTDQPIPRIKEQVSVDIEKAEKIMQKELAAQKIGTPVKVIAILQMHNHEQIWNLTCMFSSMQIFNMHINAETGKIAKAEKKSLGDFFNRPASYVG